MVRLGGIIVPLVAAYTGPGDIVSGATAFWGLRAYTSASIGSAVIRLRESGGNTESDFNTVAGGGLDMTAIATFQGANNVFVVKLYDQTGNGRDQLQATAAKQAKFSLSQFGTLPGMVFDGTSSEMLTGVNITTNQAFTYSAVYNNNNTPSQSAILINGSIDQLGTHRSAANDLFIYANNVPIITASINAPHAIQAVYNGASSNMNLDGTDNIVDAGTGNGGGTPVSLGSANTSQFFKGLIAEAGIWPVGFSGANCTSMYGNQHTYWGF